MDELKLSNCPCCDGVGRNEKHDFGSTRMYYYVECPKCGLKTKPYETPEEAIAAWNNRTDGWISHRLPTEDDADENGNVLVWNGKCSVLAYYKAAICRGNSWQPLPSAPKGE